MIHGRSLEVYVNEMELKYHKSTNVSMFVCCLRLFRLNVVSTDADCGTFPFYANLHN